eukprot:gene12770-biopygen16959
MPAPRRVRALSCPCPSRREQRRLPCPPRHPKAKTGVQPTPRPRQCPVPPAPQRPYSSSGGGGGADRQRLPASWDPLLCSKVPHGSVVFRAAMRTAARARSLRANWWHGSR